MHLGKYFERNFVWRFFLKCMHLFSFRGYGNALVFKDITDADIDGVENYMKNIFPVIFETAQTEIKIKYTIKQKMDFFRSIRSHTK